MRKARKGESNYGPFDVYTLMHVGLGALWGAAGFSPNVALLSSVGWEAIEPIFKASNPQIFPNPSKDSLTNKLGDSAAFMTSYYVFRNLMKKDE